MEKKTGCSNVMFVIGVTQEQCCCFIHVVKVLIGWHPSFDILIIIKSVGSIKRYSNQFLQETHVARLP